MTGHARRLISSLRRTPLHPQWLIRSQADAECLVRDMPVGVVLDVGCADRWVVPWIPSASTYVGLDYPATGAMLYGARPDVFGDAARLPVRDAVADGVLLLEVVEHLAQPNAALREIHRVLRPGGRILMSVPFLYPIHDAPHDYQRLTEHGVRQWLADAGFVQTTVERTHRSWEAAGVIVCLALAGSAMTALQRKGVRLLALPLIGVLVPLVNIAAWCAARLLPDWDGMTVGYRATAFRP